MTLLRLKINLALSAVLTSTGHILMGAFGGSYEVASDASIYVLGISYGLPVEWGPITKLTFHDDFSYIDKDEDVVNSSQINTTGCMISAGSLYTYIDVIFGKNAP